MRLAQFLTTTAVAVLLAACGGAGGGLGPQTGAGAQSVAYVPQSAGAAAAGAAIPGGKSLAIEAFPQPLPEPLIDLGHGVSPDITAPILNDSGTYLNGPIILASNHATAGYGVEGLAYGKGAGLYGHAGSTSITAYGVYGSSAGGAGIYGYNNGSGSGVLGSSVSGYGVKGVSASNTAPGGYFTNTGTGDALDAASTGGYAISASSTNGAGLYATSQNNVSIYAFSPGDFPAIIGTSNTAQGLEGFSSSNSGVKAVSEGNGDGVEAYTGGGTALYGSASTGFGLVAVTGGGTGGIPAIYGKNAAGNGADISGSYGVIGRSPATGFPLVLTDSSGENNLFYVDGSGNVSYRGGLFKLMATKTRGQAVAYGTTSATPTIEDTGTAQLVNGSATVPLDATFAQTIDPQRTYQVMITPDGDTRGLYVASKTATGFVVREVQGGRGSFAFDYHIYATTLGHARERMGLVSGSGLAIPHAPAAHVDLTSPAVRLPEKPH
jgi:hypothetical protein